ncbi:mandelate racemase/muconate lactonizing enzyme family protein [Paenibacillus sp. PAMC21692]|uniref:mandelate racemase/muconate lactonizing enzyme family protein n=1 Tax=Paenibacillus sp. PAMC21692 TaxID=2762320 RepID=UPI00164EBAFB|nr:dipeptide epimerase [Paenibacillus sp. PAMC21692]QNK56993.1 dipeptide epimerase [Paenibacillus sp. PAMC21692]
MKIADIQIYPLLLPMKQSFAISGGTVGSQSRGAPHVYIKVVTDSGAEGWGEARPSHRWSYETLETVTSTITGYLKPALIGAEVADLQSIHVQMNKEIKPDLSGGQPIAKAAVDMALYDAIGKERQNSLSTMWFSGFRPSVQLSYLISTPSPEEAARKAVYAVSQGYRGLDVKLGLDPVTDIEILEAVKGAAPGLFLRVDANQAYSLQQAVKLARVMERIGVDVFEQPLRADDLYGHAQLRRKTSIPIALDESIWTTGNLLQAIRAEACDTVVVKLTKMGGLTGAKRCGELAREAGLGLLGGGLTESRLALTASAHLFNYLRIEEPVDLNGPLFLADDPISSGPLINEGEVNLPNGPGIGCEISMDKLELYGCKL